MRRAFKSKGHSAELLTDKNQQAKIWELREAALGATAHVPGLARDLPGLGRQRRPPRRSRRLPARAEGTVPQTRLRRLGLRSLRGRPHPLPYRFRSADRKGARELASTFWRRPPISSCAMAARCRASMATDRRGPSSWRRCTAPELLRGVPRVQGDLGSATADESRQGVDPYPITSNLRVGPSYQPPEVQGLLRLWRGRRQLHQGDAPLRRRRCLPSPRQRKRQ